MHRSAPAGLALFAALALSGCASSPYASTGFRASMPAVGPLAAGPALAALPAAAGPVLAVNETRRPNAILQDIVLGGTQLNVGENKISVTALLPPDPTQGNTTDGDVKAAKPTVTSIQEEMDGLFPGVAMHMSNAFDRNAQGPFGYATGRGPAGATCIYAWQWIGPEHPLNLFEGATGEHKFPVSVRVRLCQPGTTEGRLVGLVRQLMIYSPVDDPARTVPAVGFLAPGTDALTAARSGSVFAPVGGMAALDQPAPPMADVADPVPAVGATAADPDIADTPPVSRHSFRRGRHRAARTSRRYARTVHASEARSAQEVGGTIPLPGDITAPAAPGPRFPGPAAVVARPAAAPEPATDPVPLPH